MDRRAKADVAPVRQRTQYTCMSASMAMCLRALGHEVTEDEVNEVMGARPMKGAAWEQALACAQHYGCRATLTMPSTVGQLKEWTDAGIPVMIAWNPEGRPWSHASVVFDVDEDGNVHVADPNIPDPEETVRLVPKGEFYGKWYEKFPNYMVRRPACAIEREVMEDGKQTKKASRPGPMKYAFEVYVDNQGRAYDDEGHSWRVRGYPEGTYGGSEAYSIAKQDRQQAPSQPSRPAPQVDKEKLEVMDALVSHRPGDQFLQSLRDQVAQGRQLSEKQLKAVRHNLYRNRMKDKAPLFKAAGGVRRVVMLYEARAKRNKKPLNQQRRMKDTGKGVSRRDPAAQAMAEGKTHGGGAAGKHQNRTRDLEKGRSRKQKHKDPKGAGYSGNDGGQDIYPNQVDHGYDKPLAGGWDIMTQLQNRLLHEQGQPTRGENPRLASWFTREPRVVQELHSLARKVSPSDAGILGGMAEMLEEGYANLAAVNAKKLSPATQQMLPEEAKWHLASLGESLQRVGSGWLSRSSE